MAEFRDIGINLTISQWLNLRNGLLKTRDSISLKNTGPNKPTGLLEFFQGIKKVQKKFVISYKVEQIVKLIFYNLKTS